MDVAKKENRKQAHRDSSADVFEYPFQDQDLCGAIAHIKGRYPEHGYVMNRIVKEMAFVIEGNGFLLSRQGQKELSKGDLIMIQPQEAFAWLGEMKLFIATTPAFDPAQYIHVLD